METTETKLQPKRKKQRPILIQYPITIGSVLISLAILWKSNLFQRKVSIPAAAPITVTGNYYAEGIQLIRANQNDQALQKFQLAQQQNNSDPTPVFGRGWAFQNMGNREEALKSYSESIRLSESILSYTYFNMGLIYSSQNSHALALGAFQETNRRNPNQAPTLYWIGFSQEMLGQKQAAIQSYTHALQVDANLAEAKARLEALKK